MKVLVACEFSGIVRDAFAALGHDAWSCDILPSERVGNHIQSDVFKVINHGWDLMLAFPPCTHLAVSGSRWFAQKRKDGRQQMAVDFFLAIAHADIPKIAIENPVGIMSTRYRKPDQIIQPYFFGDAVTKTTCLWLKGLSPLAHDPATHADKGEFYEWTDSRSGKKKRQSMFHARAKGFGGKSDGKDHGLQRSRTFQGIATAMAAQWGNA